MRIWKVVSGGQTGADRGGLDAAIQAGIPHGGWCPKGRKAEDGVIPRKYRLAELSSPDYRTRTLANIKDSDATVIFTMGALEGGSLLTAVFAKERGRAWFHVDLSILKAHVAANRVIAWLEGDLQGAGGPNPPRVCALNVAGQRESKSPGIHLLVKSVMAEVLASCTVEHGDIP